jgi:ADP-ribose pyrophosphatase YjhB (NUDIX family)
MIKTQAAFSMPVKPVRNSAKALIVHESKLLVTRNRDLFGEFYLLPGGGQNHGETLEKALMRECLEELGAQIKVLDLVLIREYLSANHEFAEIDQNIHQIEFMFACELLEQVNTRATTEPDAMQTGVEWLPIAKLEDYRLYPKTLIELIKNHSDLSFPRIYLGDTN